MSLLVDAMQPHVTHGFFALGASSTTFDDLIRGGAAYPSYDSSTGYWDLDFRTPDSVTGFLAHECARFACAAFQSYHEVQDAIAEANRLPWALIKAYYSAFYAGHSILRALGSSCTYVDGPRVNLLRGVLSAYGVQTMNSGLYRTETSPTASSLRFENLGHGQGGTHELFWRVFSVRLQRLEQDVLGGRLPQREAQSVNVMIGRVRGVLTRNASDVAWLSTVRNAVQYRQEHAVWFPNCDVSSRDRATLGRIAATWDRDPLSIDVPAKSPGVLGPFLSVCAFLVSACRALIVRIARIGARRSFVRSGPIRYLVANQLLTEAV
jgi:hypothetical protein